MWHAVKRSYSFILYFIILTGIGYLNNPHGGGLDLFSDTTFYILVGVTGIIFYYWLVYGGLAKAREEAQALTGEGS